MEQPEHDTDTQHADSTADNSDSTDIIQQGQSQTPNGPCIWDCTLCSQHCSINDKVETWNETGQSTLFLLITSNKSIYQQQQWFSMRDVSEFVLRHPAVAKGKQLNKKNIEKKLRDAINTNRSGIFLKKKGQGGGHFNFSLSDPNAALAFFTFVDGYQPFIPAITIDMTILNDSAGNISVDNATASADNNNEGLDIGSSAAMNDDEYKPSSARKRQKSLSNIALSPNSSVQAKKLKGELDGEGTGPKNPQTIGADMQKQLTAIQQYTIQFQQSISTLHQNCATINEYVIDMKANMYHLLQSNNDIQEENIELKQRLKKLEAELAQYTGANVMMGMNMAHDNNNTAALVLQHGHADATVNNNNNNNNNVTVKDEHHIDDYGQSNQ